MLRRFWVLAALALAASLPSAALGQVQPQPVYQSKGEPQAVCTLATCPTAGTYNSPVYDITGYTELNIYEKHNAVKCYASIIVFAGPSAADVVFATVPNWFIEPTGGRTYLVSGLPPYAKVRLSLSDMPGQVCNGAQLTVTAVPFSDLIQVAGYSRYNDLINTQALFPVTAGALYCSLGIGGCDGTTLSVRPLEVDSLNRLATTTTVTSLPAITGAVTVSGTVTSIPSPSNTAYAFGEVAVDNVVPTPVPAVPLANRRALSIQNNGPNDIWCGPENTVTTTTGHKVAKTGGTWSLEVGAALPFWCLAQTAAQTAGASPSTATSYTEVR